ncbi:MAG: transcriptional regulator [Clostridia bacterium]|nr:transcriptional regulator [Clostridia bacterium]
MSIEDIDEVEFSTENMTRLTPIMIYKLLKEESSESNPLTTGYILERLEEQGMKITRQTMYKDIELLKKLEFDIQCNRSRSNEYYLIQDEFNTAEQRILLDAVNAAHFIPKDMTELLAYKVAALNGGAGAKEILSSVMHTGNVKQADDRIYDYICNIAKAIEQKRKISFYYFDYNEKRQKKYRKNKELYVENPVGTVCNGNNYYLVVYNEKHGSIINYRIDRMDKVNVSREPRNVPEDINERAQEYLDSQFGMFAGEKVKVYIESDPRHVNSILDMFGDEAKFRYAPEGRVRFVAPVQLSPTFYSWIAGFSGDMKIISPSDAIQGLCDCLRSNLDQYAEKYTNPKKQPAEPKRPRKSRKSAEPGPAPAEPETAPAEAADSEQQ